MFLEILKNKLNQLQKYSMRKDKALRVIISGGGTGGHIYPAIAIANALKSRNEATEILFVGAQDRMEMEKVPKAGYEIKGLWISGIQRKLSLKNLMFPIKLLKSVWDAKRIIKKFNPDIVVGVGGYASGPTLYAGVNSNIPALVQEQNSYAGITNKLLANKVQKVCVAYDGMERYFPKENIVFTGNPVRKDISSRAVNQQEARKHFDLDENKKTLLVIGGSLGALSINESLELMMTSFDASDYQIIWQSGKYFGPRAVQATKNKVGVFTSEFIYEMDKAYAAADFVVSRAGALSISELCLAGKPSILVPYPYAAEDHQTKNAEALVLKDAALMVSDASARAELIGLIEKLSTDTEKQKTLAENIRKMGKPNADELIVDQIYSLVL